MLYPRALMVTHQGCPQTPGGRIRALGFASTRTRGRRRGPRTGDVSVSGLAGIIHRRYHTGRTRSPNADGSSLSVRTAASKKSSRAVMVVSSR